MQIPSTHVGKFQSSSERKAYTQAMTLKDTIDSIATMLRPLDGDKDKDLDFLVDGKVSVESYTHNPDPAIYCNSFYSGSLSFEPSTQQTTSMDISQSAYGKTRYRVADEPTTTTYSKSSGLLRSRLVVDKQTGDLNFAKSFLFITLPASW